MFCFFDDAVIMKKPRTTIKDIAEKLKISPSTVSRALNDHPDISKQTKKKVKDLANSLNYLPDPVALSLKMRKSKILGVIIPDIVNFFFSSVIRGIGDIAYNAGYNLMFAHSDESYEKEKKNVESLLSSRVDGILASLSKKTLKFDHFEKFIDAEIPLVFFDRICKKLKTDRVIVDDFRGAYEATEHLISKGCQNIVHLSTLDHLEIGKERKRGFLEALKKNDFEVRPGQVMKCDTIDDAKKMIPELLSRPVPPDGILAVNDFTAAETMLIAKEHGMKIPGDLAIVGFTNSQLSKLTEPGITSVDQFGYNVGNEAVKMLIRRIESVPNIYPAETKVIRMKLIVKGSSLKKSN